MIFTVYALLDEKGLLRYIGKTNNVKERLKKHLREKGKCHRVSWIKSMKNRGTVPTIVPLLEFELEKEALEEEMFLISYFRYLGANLVNGTDGGEGASGYRHTPETKANMSEKRKGAKHPLFGKTGKSNPQFGSKRNFEQRQRISQSLIGKKYPNAKNHRKPVEKWTKDGTCLLDKYPSMCEASRRVGVQQSDISLCCAEKQNTAGGFQWRIVNA